MGVLRDPAPVAYREIAGARRQGGSRCELIGNRYGYDSSHELIVDPDLDYGPRWDQS